MNKELNRLADIDGDGELSDIEKILVYAKLNSPITHSRGEIEWREHFIDKINGRIKEGKTIHWMPYDSIRIRTVIRSYKQ